MPAEVLTATAAACGSDVLTVVVGAPAALGPWPVEGHLLVVEADLERGQQLKQQLGAHPKAVVCVEVLAAQTGAAVDWHQFNDPRLNGLQALETLRPLYPNLQQTGVEQRSGRRLEDVLNAWVNQQGLRFKPELELTLRQGDPLTALQGLGAWLSQLRAVQLAIRGASGHWQDVLDGWLGERGFRALAGPAAAWQRDPLATQQLVAREKELRIAELEEQLSTQAVRLLLAQTRHEELTAERDAVRVDRDSLQELTVAHEELRASRESLQAAAEGITAERDAVSAERDAVRVECDSLQSSLQELTVAHEELRASRESLQAAAEGITAERDQLQANCHELSTQRDVMTAERDAAWAERDSLQNSLQELTIAHDQLRASRLSISVANQILELASPGAARQKICCRNCKSTRTLVLAGAGRVAPFFALRVLGVRALDDSSLCLDACLCLDCLFLTHLVELPEESLSRLYFDYRKPSYNDERIFLEPEYEEIAGQIGQGPEISSRLIGLDKYFQQLESLEYIPPGTGLHARALDWGGADGKYIPSYISNNIEQIDIYDISLDSQSRNPRMHSSSINKSGYSYIQFCHVLEHVQHPLEIVRDVAERYLTESGLLYIEVPIEEEMELLARQLLTNGNTGYWVHEHINKYCVRSLTRLVKATGHLDIIDIREDKADLGWIFADNRSAEFPIIRCLCVKTPA